jgi:CRISPR-associated protein Csb1
MDYATLKRSVAEDAAIRRRQRLQPVGGPGDKIFPPTYPASDGMKRAVGEKNAQPRHVFEQRRINGQDVWCVLVDSVQSQANRMEEALLAAVREGAVAIPYVTVDFTKVEPRLPGVTEITSLDAPHRVYDAILRDSQLDGEDFPKSPLGRRLAAAKPGDATALLEISPTALLFGAWISAWNTTGQGSENRDAKFPRALVSEIIAVNTCVEDGPPDPRTGEIEKRTSGRRTGSRIDPLGVLRKVDVFQGENKDWDISAEGLKKGKKVRPSEIIHGNIAPLVQPLGVTCDYAEHMAVISFAGLRRLGFGGGEKDAAGRALLAALGLLALAEQDARGYALRSRCDLVCEGLAPLEQVKPDGRTEDVAVGVETARNLYRDAFEAARAAGFDLNAEPVRLTPQPKLVEIVRKSQELARQGEGGEADEDAGA